MREAVTLTTDTKTLKTGVVEYWVLRWYADGHYRSKSLGRTDKITRKQAERRQRQTLNEFETAPGRRSAGRAMGLQAYLDRYFEVNGHRLAERTVRDYHMAGRYLAGFFSDDTPIDKITRADASRFKAALAAGKLAHVSKHNRALGPHSVTRTMASLKAIFAMSVRDDMLLFNPFDRTVNVVKKTTRWHYITPAEYQKITAAASPKIALVVSLCRLAGLRREEAVYLRWTDVDWQAGRIQITGCDEWQPKDRERRVIPICPELHTVLLAAFEAAPEGQERVCGDIYEGNLTRDVRSAVKRAEVAVYQKPLHSLRKSCCVDWAAKFPMDAVRGWMGHSNIATTAKYYLQTSEADFQRAASASFWPVGTENDTENGKTTDTGQSQDTKNDAQTPKE